MKILFFHNNMYPEAVEYAFSILSSCFDCDVVMEKELNIPDNQDVIVVSYGSDIPLSIKQNHLHIFADSSFWENFRKPQSLPKDPIYRFSLQDLHLMENENLEDPLIFPYVRNNKHSKLVYWTDMGSKGGRVLVCEFDILASVFSG